MLMKFTRGRNTALALATVLLSAAGFGADHDGVVTTAAAHVKARVHDRA